MNGPHNSQAEAALIARLLVDPGQLPVLALGKLTPEDFYVPVWRDTFRAMERLSAEDRPIDIVTLRELVPDEDYTSLLAEVTPGHRASVTEYADIIRRDSFRRRLIGNLDRVIRVAEESDDQGVIVAELQEATSRALLNLEDGRLISPDQAIQAYEDILEERKHFVRGHPWGITDLDDLIQPASGGDMIVVAARPSIGKTALAAMLSDQWAQTGKPVLFVSLEMSLAQLLDRATARYGGLETAHLTRGVLTDADVAVQRGAAERRRGVQVWYLDDPYATTASVRAAAAKVKLLAGSLGAIVIDYLQLLKDVHEQEVQRVTRISRQIKAIAREYDVPVLALSQLNRSTEQREDRHPRLSDIRESGAVEQDADIVIGLYRETLDSRRIDLEILKNRQGPVGRLTLDFDLRSLTIRDAA